MFPENAFELNEELSIGEVGGEGDYSFIRLWYLAVDDNENIYAMDEGAGHVKVYDKNGRFIRSIGRRGEGPGEFLYPNMIFITGEGQFVVEDFIRSLIYFSIDGTYQKTVPTSSLFPIGIDIFPEGRILALTNEPNNLGKKLGLYNDDLSFQNMIVHIPTPKPDPADMRIFQPKIDWAITPKGEIVLTYKEDYEIQIFDPSGKLTKMIFKRQKPVRITQEDINTSVARVPEGKKLVVPKNHPAVQAVLVDDVSRIFVKTIISDEDQRYFYDIFTKEGKYVAKVPLSGKVQVIRNDRLYAIEEDENGYQYIKCYKVTWNY